MKVSSAGLYRDAPNPQTIISGELGEPLTDLDLRASDSGGDVAFYVAWRAEKEAEDHPSRIVIGYLVDPDGTTSRLGGRGGDQRGDGFTAVAVQRSRFTRSGQYRIELRPGFLNIDGTVPTSEPVGDRRLAVLSVDVTV